jgi:hypothetical protein
MLMAKDEQEQGADQLRPHIWIAAEYHFPSTYSCRIPLSSENNPLAMPAPGPATVRLALIHAGIELFGLEVVRDKLFPIIRSAPVRVRPPECVAISQQVLQAYKWSENRETREAIQQESIILREMAHASGPMTVYLQVPQDVEQPIRTSLQTIGYWGQTSSLTHCLSVSNTPPLAGEYSMPFHHLSETTPLQPFFSCLVSEFQHDHLSWEEVVLTETTQQSWMLRFEIHVWPMLEAVCKVVLSTAIWLIQQVENIGFSSLCTQPLNPVPTWY